jgi:hypothetical protein
MKRIVRPITLLGTLTCLIFVTTSCRRSAPGPEESSLDHQNSFFAFLDSVTVETPTLATVSTKQTGYRELSEASSARGCQCYGQELRTLKSADGIQLQVATSLFAITSARLRENQAHHMPIHPISDPWFELSEMFIDGKLVRAIEDKELQINLQNATAPVRYAKWQDPRGGYTNAYTAWSTGQTWVIPFNRNSDERCKIPNLSSQQIQDGIDLIRIDIRVATNQPNDDVPVELIEQVLKSFNGKLPATEMRE